MNNDLCLKRHPNDLKKWTGFKTHQVPPCKPDDVIAWRKAFYNMQQYDDTENEENESDEQNESDELEPEILDDDLIDDLNINIAHPSPEIGLRRSERARVQNRQFYNDNFVTDR